SSLFYFHLLCIFATAMQFKDIIGQTEVHNHLVDMVQNNRLSHALLFLGKEGNGSLSTALAFAQYIVCEKVNGKYAARSEPSLFGTSSLPSSRGGADSCGECAACIKAQQYIHPDIHFSFPVIPRKPGDKPLSTDYIREWREFLKKYY